MSGLDRQDHAGRRRGEPHGRHAQPLPAQGCGCARRRRPTTGCRSSTRGPARLRHRARPPRLPGALPRPRRPGRARGAGRGRGGPHGQRLQRQPPPPRPPPGGPPRRHRPLPHARRHRQHAAAVGRARAADGRARPSRSSARSGRRGSTRSATCSAPARRWPRGSDWPVSSANPIQGMHVAVNRVAPGGDAEVFSPSSASTWRSALAAYTSGTAYVNHLDDTGTHRGRQARRPGRPRP